MFLTVGFLLLSPSLLAQETKDPLPFPGLKRLFADTEEFPGKIYYDNSQVKVIKKVIDEESGVVRMISTPLKKDSDSRYFIDFDPGPSADPVFVITDEKTNKVIGRLGADSLFIPGNGFLYTWGRSNNMHFERRKYEIVNNEIKEVSQPFAYVGLATKTKIPLTLTSEKDSGKTIANIPAGDSIDVVLRNDEHLLIKTQFGLVGWWKMKTDVLKGNEEIEGIYYAGD